MRNDGESARLSSQHAELMTEFSRDSGHRWRLFQLLLLATSTWAVIYSRFALGPLQEAMRVDLGLSDTGIAWLQGPAIAIPMAVGAIPAGMLVDRYSRAPLFPVLLALNLGATVMTALSHDLALLILSRIFVGLTLAAIPIAAYSMVGDLYPPAQRGKATMTVTIGEIAGAPTAFALGGTLLAMSGEMSHSTSADWRWTLLWMCLPLAAAAALMLALRDPRRVQADKVNAPLQNAWSRLWGFRAVIVTLLAARIMVWIGDGAVVVWAAPTFERTFGMKPDRTGAVMAMVLLISGVLGPLVGGALADLCQRRAGPRRTVTVLCIMTMFSAPAALFAIMPSASLAIVMLTFFLAFGFVIGVMAVALALVMIPPELRGLYLAVQLVLASLFCFGVAPVVVSGLSTLLGGPGAIGQALAIVCIVTSALGAVVFALGRRSFPTAAGLGNSAVR